MLNLYSVNNIEVEEIERQIFDLAVFASGYERRSSFIAKKIQHKNVFHSLILGFEEFRTNEIRKSNDKFYKQTYSDPIILSANEESKLYQELNRVFNENFLEKKTVKILLDYTSMSRLWYSGILNFIKLQSKKTVEVYLNYSLGEYKENVHPYSYNSIRSLPSHEGALSSNTRTLLVLSIGFYPEIVQSIIEEIEPNDAIGILAIPSLKKEYEERSLLSKELLNNDIPYWVNCPINDLESIFRTYAEITNNYINERDILFLSLGPKIFNMASILVSQRFEQVTCLYLKAKHNDKNSLEATGHCICNKITYTSDGDE